MRLIRLDRRRLALAAVATCALAAIFAVLLAVRLHEGRAPYSGDEPHYLIVAASLIYDGDVDVKNDYAIAPYRRLPNPPDVHVNTSIFTASSPHWYSSHGVGLPAIVVPGVLADNAWGAAVEMVGLSAVVLLLTFFWVRRFVPASLAAIATAALGFSPFFLGLEGRIFPDLFTAALLLGCLLILELPRPRPRQLFVLSVLVGIAPWIHFKNGFAFATIAVIAVVLTIRRTDGFEPLRRIGVLTLLVVPALVSAIGYELSVRDWYSSWLPRRMSPPGRELFAFSPIRGFEAASFDASHGLFAGNPALILILAGLPVWFKCARSSFLRLALVLGPTVLMQATFNDWSGGYAPAGRYSLQFVPALMPAVALVLREGATVFRVIAAVLIGVQWALAASFIWLRPPWILAGAPSPLFGALKPRLGFDVDRVLPTFDMNARVLHGSWSLLAWHIAAAALVAYGIAISTDSAVSQRLRAFGRT